MLEQNPYPVGSRVIIRSLWIEGTVENIHFDDIGNSIITVTRDEDGHPHLCREYELVPIP